MSEHVIPTPSFTSSNLQSSPSQAVNAGTPSADLLVTTGEATPVSTGLFRSGRQKRRSLTPSGYRVLHVLLPELVFNHAKAQAYLSNMRFPDYIRGLLERARPANDCGGTPIASTDQVDHAGSFCPSERRI